MRSILAKLKITPLLISDGAWGTMLQNLGLQIGECPELWNINHYNKVLSIPKAYIDAGSEIVKTNSFGANKFRLAHYGLEDKVYELNKTASEISRFAAKDDVLVLGSVGPTGKIIMMDEIPEAELYETFSLQCKALQDGGADAILIETFSAIDEALIAIKAAKENTSLEVICTFTFELTIDGRYKTMMGIEPKQYVEEMLKAGVDIIGTNCGNGFERMVDIIKELRSSNKDIPILVHANAGLPRIENGKIIYPETPEIIKKFVPSLLEAGVNIIGGCCGTTPSHIKAISRIINLGT